MNDTTHDEFLQHYKGRFVGVLRWEQLDELWHSVREQAEGWYVYLINHEVPVAPVSGVELERFVREVDTLLRHEHEHDYCGIVYADDRETPRLIKIFDPHNLGASCGASGHVIMPRWVLSRIPPAPLEDLMPLPASRKRWWQKLFD